MFRTLQLVNFLTGLFFGFLWLKRRALNYNAEGNYFDKIDGVIYHQDTVLVFAVLSIIFLLTAIIFSIIIHKQNKRSSR